MEKIFQLCFFYCELLQDISALAHWDVSNGTDFSCMFNSCKSLQDIRALQNWNVENGIEFSFMFAECNSLQNIHALENWDVSNGTDFSSMFANCKLLKDISLQNTLKYLSKGMFYECNPNLKIRWKQYLYTYADLLEYKKIY